MRYTAQMTSQPSNPMATMQSEAPLLPNGMNSLLIKQQITGQDSQAYK